ncbi:PxKF domain-containing protein [Microbacterium sp. 8M]|uniref:PxKF domain-containing protein n=1 Tax=Microbacterium sp. 8M TaxID=2653153 RepID=UPI00191565BC|nr:PxKF domain-containing protein [Microbacterium sp. 8M]
MNGDVMRRRSFTALVGAVTTAVVLSLLGTAPAWSADPPNLLAADLDVGMDGTASPLTLSSATSGGTQSLVDIGGNRALELRDASAGANTASYFFKRWSASALRTRINQIYGQPAGSPSVDFLFSFRLARTAASDKTVAKDVYAQLQFGNFDNVAVPRFPMGAVSLTTTNAYKSTSGALAPVTSADIAQYRFTIVPNGGTRLVSTVELGFQVRVDTGGTDEAIAIDDLSIVEAPAVPDSQAPTAPTGVQGAVSGGTASLQWSPSTDDVGVSGYDVLRDGVVAATVSSTTTSAQVTGLMPSTHYTFQVRAKDAAGNAATSSGVTLTTAAAPVDHASPFPGDATSRLAWLWDRTKAQKEEAEGPQLAPAYTARVLDGQDVTANLAKLKNLYTFYDAEQYKSLSKMYAYLMARGSYTSDMLPLVKSYFAQYAYGKLNQTENLRMANYAVGYLTGVYLPDVVDKNGNSGAALVQVSQAPLEAMIDAGVHRGWAEYESPEYTIMTYLGLNAIQQWSPDATLRQKAKMAMDVMWFEWANDWNDGYMISSLSRSKGDLAVIGDPTWRPADHTALAWAWFGSSRAQQRVGEAENDAPSAYRPNLEVLGYLAWPGMSYQPPALAVEIGQDNAKSYTSHKTTLQNSSGNAMNVFRTTYVTPSWGLGTEVQYRRSDNWQEDQAIVLRWKSDDPNSVFRVNVDVGSASIGSYDQPRFHRVMQSDGTAIGVYNSWGFAPDDNVSALFPANGAIKDRIEAGGWVLVDAGSMYFAYRAVQPATWYYQTPNDPPNKVKTTTSTHPTAGLAYAYDILRSGAAKNGWILDTADKSQYADLQAFAAAMTSTTSVDTSHIGDSAPRLVYRNLAGKTLDLTYGDSTAAPAGQAKVDGVPIAYDGFKLFDTPWLQQDQLGDVFTAHRGAITLTYDFSSWTVTTTDASDRTPPTVAWSGGPADGASYVFGTLPDAPTCQAVDDGSGPADCVVTGYDGAVGTHTLTATAHDVAGNTAEATRTYTVAPYTFAGFFAPVKADDAVKSVKAGSTVPLKFTLSAGDRKLTSTAAIADIRAVPRACTPDTPVEQLETAVTSGAGLTYDPVAGQFQYDWKTDRAATGCADFVIRAVDGSELRAPFEFR